MPTALAMAAAVQWVVSPGGGPAVRSITRATTTLSSGGLREGRVLSRNRPSTPACMKRSCQRHTTDLLLPVRRMISAVPKPSAVSKTIRARQTCFCGLFRLATIAASRRRSAALTSTTIPVRIPKTRTAASLWESRGDSYVRLEPLGANAFRDLALRRVRDELDLLQLLAV